MLIRNIDKQKNMNSRKFLTLLSFSYLILFTNVLANADDLKDKGWYIEASKSFLKSEQYGDLVYWTVTREDKDVLPVEYYSQDTSSLLDCKLPKEQQTICPLLSHPVTYKVFAKGQETKRMRIGKDKLEFVKNHVLSVLEKSNKKNKDIFIANDNLTVEQLANSYKSISYIKEIHIDIQPLLEFVKGGIFSKPTEKFYYHYDVEVVTRDKLTNAILMKEDLNTSLYQYDSSNNVIKFYSLKDMAKNLGEAVVGSFTGSQNPAIYAKIVSVSNQEMELDKGSNSGLYKGYKMAILDPRNNYSVGFATIEITGVTSYSSKAKLLSVTYGADEFERIIKTGNFYNVEKYNLIVHGARNEK